MLKIGHRGAAGHAPENTIKSFEKAIELGVDMIELDVRRDCADNLIVFHDATLERLSGGKDRRAVREVHVFDGSFRDANIAEPVPPLTDVFYQFGKRIPINVELKEAGIAERVLKLIRGYHIEDSVIVSAFDDSENEPGDTSNWVDLLWMKRQEPRLKIALLVQKQENLCRARSLTEVYPIHAVAISRASAIVLADGMRDVHYFFGQGLDVFVWTVNDVEEMKKLKKFGVDGIFSDYPDRFKEAGIE